MLPNTPLILLGGFLGCVMSIQARRPKDLPDYLLRVCVSLSFAYLCADPLCFYLRAKYPGVPKDTFVELAASGACGFFAYLIVPWTYSAGQKLLSTSVFSAIAEFIAKAAKEKGK